MSQEETSKSYKKNDLIAVMKKEDKKDPVCLFQVFFLLITHLLPLSLIKLSQNADAKSKKIKGIIFEKTETSEKNKVNFEKGKVTTISYEDILASVAPNLPGKDNTKKPADFNKYFLSKNNYSKLLNIAMGNSFFLLCLDLNLIVSREHPNSGQKRGGGVQKGIFH